MRCIRARTRDSGQCGAGNPCLRAAIAALPGIPISLISESKQTRSSDNARNVYKNAERALPARTPPQRGRPRRVRREALRYGRQKSYVGSLYFHNFSEQCLARLFERGPRLQVAHAEPRKVDDRQRPTKNEKRISRKTQPFE